MDRLGGSAEDATQEPGFGRFCRYSAVHFFPKIRSALASIFFLSAPVSLP